MTRIHHIACGLMLACAALSAQAQDTQGGTTPPQNAQLQKQEIAKGDPARWYKEDATGAEQSRTLRKEIGAALAEATIACKKGPASEREACLRDARATYKHDMDKVPQILAENKH
jgi:hypothetical protein